MNKYWSEAVRELSPYVPGEQPKDKSYIKLNTNESPYPPSPKVLDAIRRAASQDLRLYPDPSCDELRQAIFAFKAFFNPENPVIFADITYSFYPVYCHLFGLDYRIIPLEKDFSLPVERFFERNGGVVIANPNAPTGKLLPVDSIRRILEHNTERVVLVDEAYIDFGGESSVSLINEYPNLLVVQTFSKSRSLAGLRVGFAMGDHGLIEGLDRVKNSFNSYTLDRLAIAGAVEAIKDVEYFKETTGKIITTRERTAQALRKMGFEVTDSKANFLFISHPEIHAAFLFRQLKENGILVRHFNKPRIDNYLRVSVGTDQEMDVFLDEVRKLTGCISCMVY